MQKKKISKKKEAPTMKETFERLQSEGHFSPKEVKEKKKFSLREALWNYPSFFEGIIKRTSPLSYIVLFSLFSILFCFIILNNSKEIFSSGGKNELYVEGTVGAVSTLNPIFISQNEVDRAIHSLVFEKLIYLDSEGSPLVGIAESWSVSEDNLQYIFKIGDNHIWQDGESVTLDDVLFTFEVSKELAKEYGYDTVGGVLSDVSISKEGKDSIKFVLKEKNATFFQSVSVYIIPKHRFDGIPIGDIPFNPFAKVPLGSGPYKVTKSEPNLIELVSSEYFVPSPSIKSLVFKLYSDYDSLEMAFRSGVVDGLGGIDNGQFSFINEYPNYFEYEREIEFRNKLIFFNIRKDKLENKELRQSLMYITNKNELLNMSGINGVVSNGPISEGSWAYNNDFAKYEYNPDSARDLLGGLGYTKNETSGYYENSENKILSFTLSYLENDVNEVLVSSLKELWDKEGVVLNLEPLTYDQLTKEIVSTRNFEMLLYEIEVTVDPDQYNLWHSLKTNYPDLNLSGYSYERVDILLEDARNTLDKNVRKEKYALFQRYLMNDAPVLFLYHPVFKYIAPTALNGIDLSNMNFSRERYWNITDWSF